MKSFTKLGYTPLALFLPYHLKTSVTCMISYHAYVRQLSMSMRITGNFLKTGSSDGDGVKGRNKKMGGRSIKGWIVVKKRKKM